MEDTLQISAIEKDDSFSMLYASLDASKRNHKDEKAEVRFLLGNLSDVRNKYKNICLSMAENLDNLEAKHAEENNTRQAEFATKLKKLEDTIHTCATELHSQNSEKNAANTMNLLLKGSLSSIRDQIDNLFEHINRNIQNAVEEVVDIVTVASDSEDEQDHEQDNEELEVEQPQAAEDSVGSVEVGQNEQVAHETEHAQQNLSNGDALDETAKPNNNDDEGKENVRPQSTPITKVETPVVTTDTILTSVSTVDIVAKVVAPPKPPLIELTVAKNIDEPSTSGISQPKKQHNCIYCDEAFSKKSLVFLHWKNDHDIKIRRVKPARKSGSSKRKHAVIDNYAENIDDDIIEVDSANGFYVTLHGSLKKKDGKRHKKSSP